MRDRPLVIAGLALLALVILFATQQFAWWPGLGGFGTAFFWIFLAFILSRTLGGGCCGRRRCAPREPETAEV
ncbi:MAG: hypothetical protein R3247_04795 [Rhodothermales bacterium]|nr:hypothetical protein [Rhodothermales bacterium]